MLNKAKLFKYFFWSMCGCFCKEKKVLKVLGYNTAISHNANIYAKIQLLLLSHLEHFELLKHFEHRFSMDVVRLSGIYTCHCYCTAGSCPQEADSQRDRLTVE